MSVMNTMDLAPMRELTIDEIDEVSGAGELGDVGVVLGIVGAGLGVGAAIAGGPFTVAFVAAGGAYAGFGAVLTIIDSHIN